MSSHDEYSSDEEDLFDEKTNVYLGFTDVAFAEEDELPTVEDTFIGGQPIWLHPDSKPSKELLQCGNCHQDMALLLQAFAPIEDKPYDRVIYIFACKDTVQCSKKKGSVKAIRGVSKDPVKMAEVEQEEAEAAQKLLDEKLRLEDKKKLQIEMTKDLFDVTKPSAGFDNPFGAAANPFGGNPFEKKEPKEVKKEKEVKEEKNEEKVEKKEEKEEKEEKVEKVEEKEGKLNYADASRQAQPAPKTTQPVGVLPEYPGFFVFTEQETFKNTDEPELAKYKDLIEKMDPEDKKERSMSGSAALSAETAKIASMLNDKYFENFSSVVGHNSTQVLRYDLGGRPLLYSGKDDVAKAFASGTVPDPSYNPSSLRRFELQLMPKAIIDLEQEQQKTVAEILAGMSWGTIIVATDVEDYVALDENHVGYVQEYCGVQWEESV